MKFLSIIIVTLDSEPYIEACLSAIFKQKPTNVEVIIYDKESADATVKIAKKFPHVRIIAGNQTVGFAPGNDIAAKKAEGDVLFFLNPDTRLKSDFFKKLNHLTKNLGFENKIIIPAQYSYDDEKRFLHCGLGMDILGFPVNQNETGEFFYADGAAIIIDKKSFWKLGGFDPNLWIIQEDVDLSWKARMLGFEFIRLYDLIVFHKSGGYIDQTHSKDKNTLTSNLFRRYYGERNIYQNILKNFSWVNLLWIIPTVFLINCGEMLVFTLSGNFKAAFTYLEIYWWLLNHLDEILEKREFIQAIRTVGDFSIMKSMYKGSGKLRLLRRYGIPTVH